MRESSVPQGMDIFPHMPAKFVGLHLHHMAVTVEMQNTGDPALQREVAATIEHALADRPGDWRVSIVGSQADDKWEMRIFGPNAFERSYTLEGSSGEHRPEMIRVLLGKLVP
jgi:hypothetical protein